MPKSANASKKKPVKKAAIRSSNLPTSPRRVKLPKYRPISFKKRIKPVRPALTGAFRLFWRAGVMIKRHWPVFLGIIIIYAVLNIILVRGLAGTSDLSGLKSTLGNAFQGPNGKVTLGLTLFVSLLSGSSSTSASPSAGTYQALLLIIISLAVIWTLRQLYSNTKVRVRDGFYRGIYPFVPFILVLLVIGLQLVPLAIGAVIYNAVLSGGIAVGGLEKFLWLLLFVLLAAISLYMLCSSLFALYIVTLPDMTPMKALRSARQLVRYRRFVVLRKIIFLPIILLVLAAVIIVPLSLTITPAAEWIFFALSLLGLVVVHSYMYALYRELIK